ncbi:PTB-containing, cubilin and LRP1-interacting protein [Liparis tanakae]|uniref:PTB-containing, cubilin and LRP1-interacting protein n=1 Tax=Liparis tanakae TaxID=230148 RepID=A0A4Z2E7W2_9TELE|nr:PTB-containing, cubilin and LRP1-interacting protein [Liparis tanakae]
MLKTRLNVLTLRKEPLPTVIFHEPEAIELCSPTPLAKGRSHAGYKFLGDQTRSDQTRPDQTRPDQIRPDQTQIRSDQI